MCLEPVVWTDDGWWRPKNGKKPSLTNDGPNLPFTPYEIQRSDDFSSTTLGPQWFFHTHAGLVGRKLVALGPPGLLAHQDARRRRQWRCGLPGHAHCSASI